MTDRPVIFSAPMVRALLEGRKTMTRRLPSSPLWRAAAGDRLWVREAFARLEALRHNDPGVQALADGCFYRADASTVEGEIARWRPSIHMPRALSRITLTVTATKIESLQAISYDDIVAEGWQKCPEISDDEQVHRDAARDWFMDLWDDLHGVGAWAKSPDVIAITFVVDARNIDTSPSFTAR